MAILLIPQVNRDHIPLNLVERQSEFYQATQRVSSLRGAEGDIQLVFDKSTPVAIRKRIINQALLLEEVRDVESFVDIFMLDQWSEPIQNLVLRESSASQNGKKVFRSAFSQRTYFCPH